MTNEELQTHIKSGLVWEVGGRTDREPRPFISCADGFRFSVQASEMHYRTPRDNAGPYTHVEVGYPVEKVQELMLYAEEPNYPTKTVYSQVPIEVVLEIIRTHGGMK